MRHVLRWCTLAGITAAVLGLTVPASAATGWTLVTPPTLAVRHQNFLNGSFALSDFNTWAVGESTNASAGTEAPLALHWNGTAWSKVPSPTPSGSTPDWLFESVAASSTSDAWAVGEQSSGTKIHDSLYEHWNGTSWSVVTGPNEASSPQSSTSPDQRLRVRRLRRPALERDRVVGRFRRRPRPQGERGRPQRHLGRQPG